MVIGVYFYEVCEIALLGHRSNRLTNDQERRRHDGDYPSNSQLIHKGSAVHRMPFRSSAAIISYRPPCSSPKLRNDRSLLRHMTGYGASEAFSKLDLSIGVSHSLCMWLSSWPPKVTGSRCRMTQRMTSVHILVSVRLIAVPSVGSDVPNAKQVPSMRRNQPQSQYIQAR